MTRSGQTIQPQHQSGWAIKAGHLQSWSTSQLKPVQSSPVPFRVQFHRTWAPTRIETGYRDAQLKLTHARNTREELACPAERHTRTFLDPFCIPYPTLPYPTLPYPTQYLTRSLAHSLTHLPTTPARSLVLLCLSLPDPPVTVASILLPFFLFPSPPPSLPSTPASSLPSLLYCLALFLLCHIFLILPKSFPSDLNVTSIVPSIYLHRTTSIRTYCTSQQSSSALLSSHSYLAHRIDIIPVLCPSATR